MKDRRPSRLAIAMHEAGHAVIRMNTPMSPYTDEVWLLKDGETALGCVVGDARWQPGKANSLRHLEGEAYVSYAQFLRRSAWEDILEALAGPIAELRWRKWPRMSIAIMAQDYAEDCFAAPALMAGTDYDQARRRLEWLYPENPGDAFRRAWIETEEAVAASWKTIQRVGRALDRSGVLSHEELDELVSG